MIWRVLKAYERSRSHPVAGRAGDRVLTGKTDNWEGHIWVWCTDRLGREGWIAEEILACDNGQGVLLQDFNAIEMMVKAGGRLIGDNFLTGWLWAQNAVGEQGWVPLTHIEQAADL